MGINKWKWERGRKRKRQQAGREWTNINSILYEYQLSLFQNNKHLDFITSIFMNFPKNNLIYSKSIMLCKMPVLTANMTTLTFTCYHFCQFLLHQLEALGLWKLHSPLFCHVCFLREKQEHLQIWGSRNRWCSSIRL